jgi:hypothetical protein
VKSVQGVVRHISPSGALVTDISNPQVASWVGDLSVVVSFGEHETNGVHPADHGEPPGTLVAVLGASGFVELEIVGADLHEMLGIDVGQPVTIAARGTP